MIDDAAITAQITTALNAVNAAVATAGNMDLATSTQLIPVADALDVAVEVVGDAIETYDADIQTATFAGLIVGVPAPLQWPVLLQQVDDIEREAALMDMQGYLTRAQTNIDEATG